MNLTEEQHKEIEAMASLFYSPELIAINIDVDPEDFSLLIKAKQDKVYTSYIKGWLTTDIALREAIKQAAFNGSNPAQLTLLQMQKDSRL